jgi:hypothetical protein
MTRDRLGGFIEADSFSITTSQYSFILPVFSSAAK